MRTGIKQHLGLIEWISIIPIVMLVFGGIWQASARNADIQAQHLAFEETKRELRENVASVKHTADEARDKVADLSGDIKAIRALLEDLNRRLKP